MVFCSYTNVTGPGRDGAANQEGGTLAPGMSKTGKYFKVGQAARLVGVSPSTLRNWENRILRG
jgi:hypothetical protein